MHARFADALRHRCGGEPDASRRALSQEVPEERVAVHNFEAGTGQIAKAILALISHRQKFFGNIFSDSKIVPVRRQFPANIFEGRRSWPEWIG